MTVSRLMLSAALGLGFANAAAAAPDWQAIPAKTLTLFYPGQSSWEWLLAPGDHRGADKFRGGKACAACHSGEEKAMGGTIVSGNKNEPTPIPGKPGWLAVKVQFAHDAQNLYVHLEFSDAGQPDARMDPAAAKVAMMLDGGGVPEAERAGCFAACHDDSERMASAHGTLRTMYLTRTRAEVTRQGGGDALKPAAELEALKQAGYQLEYWDARLDPPAKAAAGDGTIFDARRATKPAAVSADAHYGGGMWSVTLSRRLAAGLVPLEPGRRYSIAFAIDVGHTAGRFHYVSFEQTLVLDRGSADFVAK